MTPTTTLDHFLAALREGRDLSERETGEVFIALQDVHLNEVLIADILTAWMNKGPTVDELYSLAKIMRDRARKIESKHPVFIDTAGTGASRIKTFNISTAAAFVIAGAGVAVAKHGNRAATSRSGSADVIAELGVKVETEPEKAAKCLDDIGICFMFAPYFHSLSPTLGKVRRGLGFPSVFNIVGPLCNPAGAPHQIMGVWDRSLVEKVSQVMARLGTARSWVIHGTDGLDEITLSGATHISEISNGQIADRTISPADFGLEEAPIDGLSKLSPVESAALIRDILANKRENSAAKNLVLMNAAAAIYITGASKEVKAAFAAATESLESGAAAAKLAELVRETNK
jgi:anthranilate phosphoribosyltransferase/anthranilate synthase/phosphoribosyltransferase